MEPATERHALSPVLVALFKGVLYQDQNPDLWHGLLQLQSRVRDHASVFGLELMVDESEGYAYLRQRPPGEGEQEPPRLVHRRQLGYGVSLLLALVRKKLAEHDASGGDTRLILSRDQLVDLVQLFIPSGTNEAKLVDRTLVLEREKYSYLKFCSDISGQDPEAHNGEPSEAVTIVRNWLRTHSDFGMPSAEQMLRRFTRFRRQLPAMCHRLHLNTNSLIFVDYAALVSEWLAENPLTDAHHGQRR